MQSSETPSAAEETPFRYVYSDGLGELLEQLDISLLVSTYQAGKLCTFRSRDGRIKMLPRTFKKAMGIAANRERMAIATQQQIWFLENEPVIGARIEPKDSYDACYIPRRSHVTSNIDLHEIAWGGEELWLVNTLFSCLATIDASCSFVPRWQPPFITRLARHDRCHLNGLAMADGTPAYVTLFAASDQPQGWREHKREGGQVLHVGSGEVVMQGLSMPHSPRLHGDHLWVLDSGNGRLLRIDPEKGQADVVTKFDGYPRGLAFCGRFAFVGLSKIREKEIFGGVPIAEESEERPCGVVVVDLQSGNIVGRLEFEQSVEEIFDVQLLFGVRFPTVVGFDQDTIERAASIGAPPETPVGFGGTLGASDQAAADNEISKGLRLLRQDAREQAADHFRNAVRLAPYYPKAHNNLGYVLLELDDIDGAIESCQQAVRNDPDYHLARNNLGNALRANGEFERAKNHYEAAITLRPDYASAHHNLGVVLCALGKPLDAQAAFRRALALQPDLAVAWNRLADAQTRTGEFDAALESHDRAIELEPDNLRLRADRAHSLVKACRLEDAADGYRDAQRLEPDSADLHWNLGLVHQMMGDYSVGWTELEWRLDLTRAEAVRLTPAGQQVAVQDPSPATPRKTEFPQPQWDGSPLKDRQLLIWAEQGVGDEFMFASMFSEMIGQAKHCVIECDFRSLALMSRSFPSAEFVPKSAPIQSRTQSGEIDFQCAMGSLGLWLRPNEESFSRAKQGYLKADKNLTERLRAKYLETGAKTVVGLSWFTANSEAGWQRDANLDLWQNDSAAAGHSFRQPAIRRPHPGTRTCSG